LVVKAIRSLPGSAPTSARKERRRPIGIPDLWACGCVEQRGAIAHRPCDSVRNSHSAPPLALQRANRSTRTGRFQAEQPAARGGDADRCPTVNRLFGSTHMICTHPSQKARADNGGRRHVITLFVSYLCKYFIISYLDARGIEPLFPTPTSCKIQQGLCPRELRDRKPSWKCLDGA